MLFPPPPFGVVQSLLPSPLPLFLDGAAFVGNAVPASFSEVLGFSSLVVLPFFSLHFFQKKRKVKVKEKYQDK